MGLQRLETYKMNNLHFTTFPLPVTTIPALFQFAPPWIRECRYRLFVDELILGSARVTITPYAHFRELVVEVQHAREREKNCQEAKLPLTLDPHHPPRRLENSQGKPL